MKSLIICVAAAAGNASVSAFTVSNGRSSLLLTKKNKIPLSRLHQQKETDDQDERAGMQDAFSSLDDLSSLDLGTPAKSSESKINLDLASVDVDKILKEQEEEGDGLTQDEVNLYKDMYQEMENDEGDSVYGDILSELSGDVTTTETTDSTPRSTSGKGFGKLEINSSPTKPLNDADGIGALSSNQDDNEQLTAVELSQDTDEFMRRALEEALDDAKIQTQTAGAGSSIVDESILDDEEFMKEINAVFDRANEKLIKGVSEIREEQAALTQASADKRDEAILGEEARLKAAEGSVSRLVNKVKEQTMEVEKAVEELKSAQENMMSDDPLFQAADLKKAGLVRQSAVVGAILFSFRTAGELFFVTQGTDVEGHGASAAIQGLIALACGAYLVFF